MRHKKQKKILWNYAIYAKRFLNSTRNPVNSKPCKLESLYMVNNILVQDLKKKIIEFLVRSTQERTQKKM